MKFSSTTQPLEQLECDALVLGHYQKQPLNGPTARVDSLLEGKISRLLEEEVLTGKLAELTPIYLPDGFRAKQLLLVGLGTVESFNQRSALRACGTVSKHLASRSDVTVALSLGDQEWDPAERQAAISGLVIGCQGQDLHRAERSLFPITEAVWHQGNDDELDAGRIVGEAVNFTRRLVNEPPSTMNPVALAEAATELGEKTSLAVEVWDEDRLQQENCESLLAVARGSDVPPRLVILKHQGGPEGAPPLALVGKGVTFDSGGLSLKPSEGMKTMKCDMAGAATVLGAMQGIADLNLPVNVIGLVGLVENMVSGRSYKLGDVLHARSGKTIEVLNTDAEGRLVLADVLNVAVEHGPTRIVDLATLTGACVVALGLDVAGLMTNDQEWCDAVAAAAKTCGEAAWQLPMFDEYGEQIRSQIADIKNIGEGRWGGAITAAKFLEEFVDETSWVHIDIAGPAFSDRAKSWVDGGATGAFVRTLIEVAKSPVA